jgi:hypothetical protein
MRIFSSEGRIYIEYFGHEPNRHMLNVFDDCRSALNCNNVTYENKPIEIDRPIDLHVDEIMFSTMPDSFTLNNDHYSLLIPFWVIVTRTEEERITKIVSLFAQLKKQVSVSIIEGVNESTITISVENDNGYIRVKFPLSASLQLRYTNIEEGVFENLSLYVNKDNRLLLVFEYSTAHIKFFDCSIVDRYIEFTVPGSSNVYQISLDTVLPSMYRLKSSTLGRPKVRRKDVMFNFTSKLNEVLSLIKGY